MNIIWLTNLLDTKLVTPGFSKSLITNPKNSKTSREKIFEIFNLQNIAHFLASVKCWLGGPLCFVHSLFFVLALLSWIEQIFSNDEISILILSI